MTHPLSTELRDLADTIQRERICVTQRELIVWAIKRDAQAMTAASALRRSADALDVYAADIAEQWRNERVEMIDRLYAAEAARDRAIAVIEASGRRCQGDICT